MTLHPALGLHPTAPGSQTWIAASRAAREAGTGKCSWNGRTGRCGAKSSLGWGEEGRGEAWVSAGPTPLHLTHTQIMHTDMPTLRNNTAACLSLWGHLMVLSARAPASLSPKWSLYPQNGGTFLHSSRELPEPLAYSPCHV